MIHNLWFRKITLKDTKDEGIFQYPVVLAWSCAEISQVSGDYPSPSLWLQGMMSVIQVSDSHDVTLSPYSYPDPDGQGLTPILTLELCSQQIGFINSTKWVKFEYWL